MARRPDQKRTWMGAYLMPDRNSDQYGPGTLQKFRTRTAPQGLQKIRPLEGLSRGPTPCLPALTFISAVDRRASVAHARRGSRLEKPISRGGEVIAGGGAALLRGLIAVGGRFVRAALRAVRSTSPFRAQGHAHKATRFRLRRGPLKASRVEGARV